MVGIATLPPRIGVAVLVTVAVAVGVVVGVGIGVLIGLVTLRSSPQPLTEISNPTSAATPTPNRRRANPVGFNDMSDPPDWFLTRIGKR
jgi:hypothetical protein